eukprot:g1881.t1
MEEDGGREDPSSSGAAMAELSLEKTISRFRFQYEKAHRAMLQSMERERKLIQECEDVKTKLANNAEQLELAFKWKKEDDKTISMLRNELEMAWRSANLSKRREKHALQLVAKLREEVAALSRHTRAASSTATTEGLEGIEDEAGLSQSSEGGRSNASSRRPSLSEVPAFPTFQQWKDKKHIHRVSGHGKPALETKSRLSGKRYFASAMQRAEFKASQVRR